MYVRTYQFKGLTPSSSFSDLSVRGRKRVVGISVTPLGIDGSADQYRSKGTLKLHDTDQGFTEALSDALIEFPIQYWGRWTSTTFSLLSDSDGYVLFENGVSINSTTDSGVAPLTNSSVTIFYA